MKPTRKVQAQRKFAQGAYAPPVVAPSSSAANLDKKAELPACREEQRNVVRNYVSARVLLDYVSLKNLHIHMEPVVLIERLPESRINKNKVQKKTSESKADGQPRNIIKGRVTKWKRAVKTPTNVLPVPRFPYVWDMTLRSRTGKTLITKKLPKKQLCAVRKRKVVSEPKDRKIKKIRNSLKENFTADDNKPLTFFTKDRVKTNTRADKMKNSVKSVEKKKKPCVTKVKNTRVNAHPKVNKRARTSPPRTRVNSQRRTKSTSKEIQETLADATKKIISCNNIKPDPMPQNPTEDNVAPKIIEGFSHNPSTPEKVDPPPNQPMVIFPASIGAEMLDPQPGPSGLQLCADSSLMYDELCQEYIVTNTTSDNVRYKEQYSQYVIEDTTVPYYNDHGIQRWITGTTPLPIVDNTVPEPETSTAPPEPAAPLVEPPKACPADSWRTLKEVVTASTEELDARCNKCKTCSKIEKLFKVSSLLEKHRQVECTYKDTEKTDETAPRNDNVVAPDDDNEHLYMELLPSHPKLMIKMKVQHVHDKQILSARLIPKSDAKLTNEFMLVEHEYLVDQLIETLNLSLREAPVNVTENVATIPNSLVSDKNAPAAVEVSSFNLEQCIIDLTQNEDSKSEVTEARNSFPKSVETAKLVDAPVFRPTREEFSDPVKYFEKIYPTAAKFGICRIVPPPRFTPDCKINDDIRFNVTNQYITRLYSRWGPAARELCAIRACLKTQSLNLTRAPLLDGVEMNLPKLYQVVQRHGGLEKVINKNRWGRVAEDMHYPKMPNLEKKLDNIYVKYLLPYDTLSQKERQEMLRKVEKCWSKRSQKILERASNPLHRQKRLLGESDSSGDDTGDEDEVGYALAEAEDCIVPGSCMNLSKFKKVAMTVEENYMKQHNLTTAPAPSAVEDEYWRVLLFGTDHICVNSAFVDTGEEGYGFSKNRQDPFSRHPWNMKMLSQNKDNVLRFLGSVLGVTVPTLHLGMMYSTSCWHRDPHALPWLEYMHQGPTKMWYGIPDDQSRNFRKAAESLCPMACQNKSIWLPSDIMMIPPALLIEHNVSLSKATQNPGEFIMIFPKAYSCSICTGYTLSESVYFAPHSWLNSIHEIFQEVRESCEPTMIALEPLLLAVAADPRPQLSVLQQVHATLTTLARDERRCREELRARGLPFYEPEVEQHHNRNRRNTGSWDMRDLDECEVCRMTLYLSKVTGINGKKSSVCLQHALRLLDARKPNEINDLPLQVVIYVTAEELDTAIAKLQVRLGQGPIAT